MAEYSIKDVTDITKRRRKTIVISGVASALLLFGIILFAKPEPIYEAEAALKVEKVTTVGELLTGVTKMGDPVITAAAMIKSFPVLENVAKKTGIIPAGVATAGVLASPQYMGIIKEMEGRIVAARDKAGGNIVIVKVQHPDPAIAKKLAYMVAESYREVAFYERNRNAIEETKLVKEKLAEAEANLTKSRNKLNEYRKNLELTTVTDENRVILERYIDRKRKVDELRFKVASIDEDIRTLKSGLTLKDATRWIYTPGGIQAGILYQLNNALRELKIKEGTLLTYYTSSHPEVIAVREQKSNVTTQIITYLEAESKQAQYDMKVVADDMQTTHGRLKDIPDDAKEYSILEDEVTANAALYNKILLKQQEVSVRKSEMAEEVTIVRYPVDPKTPITQVAFVGNMVVSLLLSVILGFVGGFVHEAIDTVPRKIDVLAEIFGLPVLTTISDWNRPEMVDLAKDRYPDVSEREAVRYLSLSSHFMADTAVAEEFRAVAPALLSMAKDNDIKVLGVMSAVAGEGATTFAANLAISLSQAGRTVALVDADLKDPSIHKLFGIENKPGLADILIGNYEWETAIRRITDLMLGEIRSRDLFFPAGLDNLYILTSGEKVDNPSNLINSARMEATIGLLKNFFDFVIVDSAPALQSSETSILARKIDAAILLTEHEKLPRGTLIKFRSLLEQLKVKAAGLIVNKGKFTKL
jgi:capsular exopolysaccharide synthesis family protein